MKNMILPVAGRSSRFPGMRPKWLLTMPSGKLMVEESVQRIDLSFFDRIIVTCLREHLEKYVDFEALQASFKENISEKVEFCILDAPTRSHAETIYLTLNEMEVKGSIYLKDCDNTFYCDLVDNNSIATVSLDEIDLIDAKNKSYVQLGDMGNVLNIIEKKVISTNFCCGGYSFEKTDEFLRVYQKIANLPGAVEEEIYISHIIYQMLLEGITFNTHSAQNYTDWGTLREYRHVQRQSVTLFCDIDGVILNNSSKFALSPWDVKPILENVEALKKFQDNNDVYIVITTSRPETEKLRLQQFFEDAGLVVKQFVMGLPHCKRVIINDFSKTNQYPSAIAINLTRDANTLSSYLEHLGS